MTFLKHISYFLLQCQRHVIVITVKGINVTFNKLSGLARRPISHTCTGTIELSSTYSSLPEFEAELKTVLHSEYSWTMDCI